MQDFRASGLPYPSQSRREQLTSRCYPTSLWRLDLRCKHHTLCPRSEEPTQVKINLLRSASQDATTEKLQQKPCESLGPAKLASGLIAVSTIVKLKLIRITRVSFACIGMTAGAMRKCSRQKTGAPQPFCHESNA